MKKNKFRVWDCTSRTFLDEDFSLGVLSGEIRGIYGERFPDFDISQYIDVDDKNGKEIFEGDIVKGRTWDGIDIFGVVVFKGGSYYINGSTTSFYRWYDYDIEVIGNVFENENLLDDE